MTSDSKSKHALKHTHLSATFTAALYNNRPWNLFPLREPRRRPKKEKRLGIVSSYVTWMSNNFGARGCRISNVEAGLYSLSSGDSSPSLGLEQQCDASAATVSTAARRTLLAYCSSLTLRPWPQCRQ